MALADNAPWVRRFIREHPEATIDEIARAANNARRGLPRGVIADIRQEVRIQLEREQREVDSTGPKPAPFNAPRLVTPNRQEPPRLEPEPVKPPPAPVATPPQAVVQEHPEATKRKKWISDMAEKDPGMPAEELHRLYNATWPRARSIWGEGAGTGVALEYIRKTLRAARELTGAKARRISTAPTARPASPATPAVPAFTPTPFEELVRQSARALLSAMPSNRIKSLSLTVADTGEVDWKVVEAPLGGRLRL